MAFTMFAKLANLNLLYICHIGKRAVLYPYIVSPQTNNTYISPIRKNSNSVYKKRYNKYQIMCHRSDVTIFLQKLKFVIIEDVY